MTDSNADRGGAIVSPFHGPSKLITSVDTLCELDRQLWEVTSGLPVKMGSIFKVPSSAYHRWGIGITPENRAELARLSSAYYEKDYDQREKFDDNSGKLERTPLRGHIESQMARFIAETVKEILHSLDDGTRQFDICDIAASTGQTSSAIAAALRTDPETNGIADRVTFHLVDYSAKKLSEANGNLRQFSPKGIAIHPMRDEDFLVEAAERSDRFDIAVSLSHFHHKSFADHLELIRNVLADDGALVSGDWHSGICNHPFNLYGLLEKMGLEGSRLDRFRELLGPLLLPDPTLATTQAEAIALEEHYKYWIKVAAKLSSTNLATKPRVYLLEAYDTSRERREKLEKAGFSTDIDRIRLAFPKARLSQLPKPMTRDSDLAVVMAATKLPKPG